MIGDGVVEVFYFFAVVVLFVFDFGELIESVGAYFYYIVELTIKKCTLYLRRS